VTVATYMRSEVLIVGGGLGGVAAALAARCVRTGVTPHQVAIPGDDNVLVKAGSCPSPRSTPRLRLSADRTFASCRAIS
jgi:hypothetical protein